MLCMSLLFSLPCHTLWIFSLVLASLSLCDCTQLYTFLICSLSNDSVCVVCSSTMTFVVTHSSLDPTPHSSSAKKCLLSYAPRNCSLKRESLSWVFLYNILRVLLYKRESPNIISNYDHINKTKAVCSYWRNVASSPRCQDSVKSTCAKSWEYGGNYFIFFCLSNFIQLMNPQRNQCSALLFTPYGEFHTSLSLKAQRILFLPSHVYSCFINMLHI